jgi:CP family cyanate transporter-like MFS transporter
VVGAVLLLALNLRLAVNAVGVVLPQIRADLGLSTTTAGLLTALPTLVFAGAGIVTPALAGRIGPHRTVVLALVAVTAGQLLRVSDGTGALFAGTLLALTGLAAGNVLLPGLVRAHFPDRITTVTSVYATVMAVGATIGSGLTIPVQNAVDGGWRTGLGVWAGVGLVAVLPWVLVARAAGDRTAPGDGTLDDGSLDDGSLDDGPVGERSGRRRSTVALRSLRHSGLAWTMAGFFALQAANVYVVLGGLGEVLLAAGVGEVTMGALLAMAPAIAIMLSLGIPVLLRRQSRIPYLITAFGICYLIGYLGLVVAPAAGAWVWLFFIGIGGGTFPTVLTLVALRARTADGVIALSAFTQCFGYLLASTGPLVFGLLHDLGGGWTPSLILMIISLVPLVGLGLRLARPRYLEDELRS